ncbi:MAG: hypothetical protein AABX17_02120 [Nanoarchaeota archaeon]
MIKNKKAFELLGEHTVNLIIAALCIVALLLLGSSVYNLLSADKQEAARAQGELNKLSGVISNLQERDAKTINYPLIGPEGWALVGWPLEDGMSANYCISQGWTNCLCFCDLSISGIAGTKRAIATKTNIREACDGNPICVEIKVKDFSVNPSDSVFLNLIGLGTKHKPIIIQGWTEADIKNLKITYDKANDKLTIVPV